MDCPECHVRLIHETSTIVCPICGIETQFLSMLPEYSSYQQSHAVCPVQSYDRSRRFLNILDQVVTGQRTKSDDRMIEHLSQSAPYHDIHQIISAMKKSSLRDKRYNCIHLFVTLFCKNYIEIRQPTNWIFRRNNFIQIFKDIECVHKILYHKTAFFNYLWLLRELLILYDLCHYVRYIKVLKCSKRNRIYHKMLKCIINYINGEDRFVRVRAYA